MKLCQLSFGGSLRRQSLLVPEVGKGFNEEVALKLGLEAWVDLHQGVRVVRRHFRQKNQRSKRSVKRLADGVLCTGSRRKEVDGGAGWALRVDLTSGCWELMTGF